MICFLATLGLILVDFYFVSGFFAPIIEAPNLVLAVGFSLGFIRLLRGVLGLVRFSVSVEIMGLPKMTIREGF
jgi:hypothetical protein